MSNMVKMLKDCPANHPTGGNITCREGEVYALDKSECERLVKDKAAVPFEYAKKMATEEGSNE